MDVSSDSQIDFVIDEYDDTSTNGAQVMSDADYDTTLGPPNDGHLPPASNAADAPTASGSHDPTPRAPATATSCRHDSAATDESMQTTGCKICSITSQFDAYQRPTRHSCCAHD